MRARLLVFDPDIQGRRLLRQTLSELDLELSVTVRATGETTARALERIAPDAIIIGLPADLSHLIPIITQFQLDGRCPPVFFLGDENKLGGSGLPKTDEGVRQLVESLAPRLRAYKLRLATSRLSMNLAQVDGSARSHIARQTTELFGKLDIPAMYVSIDPKEHWWELRSSNYPEAVNDLVISVTDSHGGVAPDPGSLSGPLGDLLSGTREQVVWKTAELLRVLIPAANNRSLKQIERALKTDVVRVLRVADGDRLHGALLLGGNAIGPKSESLRQLSARLGTLLSQAEEYDVVNQRARSMHALQEVMLSLSATLDPSDLLENVLEKLERVVPFNLASIALDAQRHLSIHACRGDRKGCEALGAFDWDSAQDWDPPMRLVSAGEPVLLDAVRYEEGGDQNLARLKYGSWIGVPISWGAEQLGYLFLASKETGVLEPIHLEITVGFARQLAIALQNARLLQGSRSRAEKLKLVNDIGRYAISVLDPQQLVEKVATRVNEVFGYFAVRILLVEGEELIPYALDGGVEGSGAVREGKIELEEIREIAHAVQNISPVQLDASSPRWSRLVPAELKGARSAVIIPLSVASEVIGVMEIYAQSVEALGQEDIEVLEVLAAQIAISVINARLFSEIRDHTLELESRVEDRTQELRSQKERTEAILRSVADAVLVLTLDGEVVLTNPSAQELLKGEGGAELRESLRALFAAEGMVQTSIEIGQVTYQALASPFEFDTEAQGTVVVLRDITRLKELDQLKSQFVATVSHELRTPLTNIKLYLSLLRSAGSEKWDRYYKVLVRETERLSDMIENLLNLSRLETRGVLEKETLPLADLLQMVADNHEPACVKKGIGFTLDLAHSPMILAERAQIIQVFTNLLANAIAYTPTGGEIMLKVAGIEEIESKTYVRVIVQDSGVGIRKDDLPHIFDRFYRGAGAQQFKAEGSGLGLAIVREILDNHAATIAVDSRPGEGTKFTVWLPALGE